MMHSRIEAKPLTLEMLSAVEGLSQTADQMSVLLELADKTVREFRAGLAKHHSGIDSYGEWDCVLTLMTICEGLLDRVRAASDAVEQAAYPESLS